LPGTGEAERNFILNLDADNFKQRKIYQIDSSPLKTALNTRSETISFAKQTKEKFISYRKKGCDGRLADGPGTGAYIPAK
jgi:hypothetical protein